jgi:glycosyltransferase involved in cell wall biosynthesis
MRVVLFLNLYSSLGGAENALLHLLAALDRTRCRPLVVVGREGPLVDALRAQGVETIVLPFPAPPLWHLALPWILWRELRAAWRLRRLVREAGAGIIHAGDVLGLLLALPARLSGARVVYQVNYLGGRLRLLLMNVAALLCARRVLVFSEAQRRDLLARTWLLRARTQVIPPGIDARPAPLAVPSQARAALGLAPGAPVVGMVARYDRWKGHKVFLRAMARLRDSRRDLQVLVVGGSLNSELLPHVAAYRDDVLAELRRLGLEDAVRLLGYVPRVAEVMAAMDVLVCPSEDEPFGLVVVEALALGTPVVVADSGGPPEIVEQGRCGLVFPTGDAVALASQVERLLADVSLRRVLAAAGRERAQAAFSAARYARDVEALYGALA